MSRGDGFVDAIIRMRGISKSFGSLRANDSIDFELYPGETHALVGENGAGERHDLALADLELRIVQRVDAREVFLDPGHSENRIGHFPFPFPFLLRRVFLYQENETFCSYSAQNRLLRRTNPSPHREKARGIRSPPPRAAIVLTASL